MIVVNNYKDTASKNSSLCFFMTSLRITPKTTHQSDFNCLSESNCFKLIEKL